MASSRASTDSRRRTLTRGSSLSNFSTSMVRFSLLRVLPKVRRTPTPLELCGSKVCDISLHFHLLTNLGVLYKLQEALNCQRGLKVASWSE